jgi:hypothetical protein
LSASTATTLIATIHDAFAAAAISFLLRIRSVGDH